MQPGGPACLLHACHACKMKGAKTVPFHAAQIQAWPALLDKQAESCVNILFKQRLSSHEHLTSAGTAASPAQFSIRLLKACFSKCCAMRVRKDGSQFFRKLVFCLRFKEACGAIADVITQVPG